MTPTYLCFAYFDCLKGQRADQVLNLSLKGISKLIIAISISASFNTDTQPDFRTIDIDVRQC